MDIIAKVQGCVIAKIEWEAFAEYRDQQPFSAIRFYNRLIKHKSYKLIYDVKNNEYLREQIEERWAEMQLKDTDLFIDFKLGGPPVFNNLYEANRNNLIMVYDTKQKAE